MANDYEVIVGPNEVRMRSAKRNQDLRSKACISCKRYGTDSDSEDIGLIPVSAAICTVGSGCRPVCKT